jgi:hypothetical protein
MGNNSSKVLDFDFVSKIKWDITESPDKNLFIKLPDGIKGIQINCPIHATQFTTETIKIKAQNTSNIIPYLDIFKEIYKVYKVHKHKIINYAEKNDLPIEIYFSRLIHIKNKNNISIYILELTN